MEEQMGIRQCFDAVIERAGGGYCSYNTWSVRREEIIAPSGHWSSLAEITGHPLGLLCSW